MTKFYLSIVSLFFFVQFSSAQPCIDGFAGEYPCENVDQLAFMPNSMFGVQNIADLWGWTSIETGREYAVVGFDNKTAFIDITTPNHPLYLGFLPTHSIPSLWRDVKVIGKTAYIVSEAEGHGMQMFDLTRLERLLAEDTPVVFDDDGHYDGFSNCHNVAVDTLNQYVYAVGSSTFGGGLHILDASDSNDIEYAGSDELGGYVHDAQIVTYNGPDQDYVGSQICIGFNADVLVIYDVTDKLDIQIISTSDYEDVGYVHQGWLTEDNRYLISGDERDETDFDYNTRGIIWDLVDLDNPVVINYMDYENTSIDHNLYVRDEMVYLSNYTSGLRVYDDLEIADGHLEYFGSFDVVPQTDDPIFIGSWSNYPYFKSRVNPVSNMYGGLHLLKARFAELSTTELLVCQEDEMLLNIKVNKRIFGNVQFEVEMEAVPGLIPELTVENVDGAPASSSIQWSGLDILAPGYYPGKVIITYDVGIEVLEFVLIKEGNDPLSSPQILFPDEETVPNQLVNFEIIDALPNYGLLQVALDVDFEEIVFEETMYGQGTSFSYQMPFDETQYYWRVTKPTACGEDESTGVGAFLIGEPNGVNEAKVAVSTTAVYPNPVVNQFRIDDELIDVNSISAYDISGRQVQTWNIAANSSPLFDASELPVGVYTLRSNGGSFAAKLVKQ